MTYIEIYFVVVLATLIHLLISAYMEYKKGADLSGIKKAKTEVKYAFEDIVNAFGLTFGCLILSIMVTLITLSWVSVLPFIRIKNFLKRR